MIISYVCHTIRLIYFSSILPNKRLSDVHPHSNRNRYTSSLYLSFLFVSSFIKHPFSNIYFPFIFPSVSALFPLPFQLEPIDPILFSSISLFSLNIAYFLQQSTHKTLSTLLLLSTIVSLLFQDYSGDIPASFEDPP